MQVTERLSFAPLVAIAREMSSRENTSDISTLLATLEAADRELARETTTLKTNLRNAENRAKVAESRHANLLRELEATAKEVSALKELVSARELAHRAQDKLVVQLKQDNLALRKSYEAAVNRTQSEFTLNERRISVTVNGNTRNMSFSDKELADMFVENERLENVGKHLVKQVETQKIAHLKLRNTVAELMTQLEDGAKENDANVNQVQNLKVMVGRLEKCCVEKEEKAEELQRKLNKLQAEYQAVSAANSYNNAELVKMKIKFGSGKRNDPGARSRSGGGVLGGVENLLHRRNAK